jgi:recombination protein RecA
MAARERLDDNHPITRNRQPEKLKFIYSGSTLLDLVLGGGWSLGSVVNIVGDRSSGKTLLAIEATANYAMHIPKVKLSNAIRYSEAEFAFDEGYANTLGFPLGVHTIPEEQAPRTVEEFHNDLKSFLSTCDKKLPNLYVQDSLDALSDEAELKRDIDKGSYGAEKAKFLSKLFRLLAGDVQMSNCTLFVISQIRDKIGVMFGEKHTRSGGRALEFYASQIVWLTELGKITRTVKGVKRVTGVQVRARAKKNKVGIPFRECEFNILFGWGVDDETSMLEWLLDTKTPIPYKESDYKNEIASARSRVDRKTLTEINLELKKLTVDRWMEIERSLEVKMRKYSEVEHA